MNILYSIVVPVYNAENYLEECFHSVLKQTYANWELILIDDGSTDNSGKLCDDFRDREQRVKVCHQSNQGALASRHNGISMITGDYTLFLDADDKLENDLLERLTVIISQYSCDAVFYRLGTVPRKNNIQEVSGKVITKEAAMERILAKANNCLADKAFKSSCIKAFDINDNINSLKINLDFIQLMAIMPYVKSVVELDEVLYCYRIVQGSVSRGVSPQKVYDIITSSKWVKNHLQINNEFDKNNERWFYTGLLIMLSARFHWLYVNKESKEWKRKIYNNDMYIFSKKYEKLKNIPFYYYILLKMFRYRQGWFFSVINFMIKHNRFVRAVFESA